MYGFIKHHNGFAYDLMGQHDGIGSPNNPDKFGVKLMKKAEDIRILLESGLSIDKEHGIYVKEGYGAWMGNITLPEGVSFEEYLLGDYYAKYVNAGYLLISDPNAELLGTTQKKDVLYTVQTIKIY